MHLRRIPRKITVFLILAVMINQAFLLASGPESLQLTDPRRAKSGNSLEDARFLPANTQKQELSPEDKLEPLLRSPIYTSNNAWRNLYLAGDTTRIILTAARDLDVTLLSQYMKIAHRYSLGAGSLITGYVKLSNLPAIASLPFVIRVMADRRLEYPKSIKDSLLDPSDTPTMFKVRDITGTNLANTTFHVNGSRVNVAVLDTGVDFAQPDMQSRVARDEAGNPLMFDADMQGLVLTNNIVHRVGNTTTLQTAGQYKVYTGCPSGPVSCTIAVNWPHNQTASTSIISQSGSYHFGIALQIIVDEKTGGVFFVYIPTLVTDPITAGVYDTVYFDLSTAYYNLSLDQIAAGISPPPPPPPPSLQDFNFTDETAHHFGDGTELVYRDFTGDGVPDFSVGTLGATFADPFGVMNTLLGLTNFGLYPGFDPAGNYLNLMFDFFGHGTSVSASIVSQGKGTYNLFGNGTLYHLPGIAPGARIMPIKTLWLGNFFNAFFWSAGFDTTNTTTLGDLTYTGKHKADIISNSWGISEWPQFAVPGFRPGSPAYDLLSLVEDFIALPDGGGFFPGYPGTLIVHAMGNGGPGYATMTNPGFSSFTLSVGASTTFHWRALLPPSGAGEKAGSFDDLAAFSNRGPNAIGEPKPDVVNVGLAAFDLSMVYYGYGNGANAFGLFAGTSLATPLTAGSAALVIQAFRNRATSFTPDIVKSILMSTADDIMNDPFAQGSGRVNSYKAVSAILAETPGAAKVIYGYSSATWQQDKSALASALNYWFQFALTQIAPRVFVNPPSLATPFQQANWFAGEMTAGSSSAASFTIFNPTSDPVSVRTDSYFLNQTGSFNITAPAVTSSSDVWFNNIPTPPSSVDLMRITLDYAYSAFDDNNDHVADNVLFLYVYNGQLLLNPPPPATISLINYDFATANTQEVRIANPASKFTAPPLIRVRVFQFDNKVKPIPLTIHVYYYRKTLWWASGPSMNLKAGSSASITAQLNVPTSAIPGVYEGFLRFNATSALNSTVRLIMPVSLVIPVGRDGYTGSFGGANRRAPTPYDNSYVFGESDWSWRYETGDWRAFKVNFDQSTVAAAIQVKWESPASQIDLIGLTPTGFVQADTSQWLGSGVFLKHSPATSNSILLDGQQDGPGTYTVLLHNDLYSGLTPSERFTGNVAYFTANPRSIDLLMRPGAEVNFTVSLGAGLDTILLAQPASTGSVTLAPFTTLVFIPSNSSFSLVSAVAVAQGTPDGAYQMVLKANLFDSLGDFIPVVIPVTVQVDGTSPLLTILQPTDQSYTHGTTTIIYTVSDPHLARVTYSIDGGTSLDTTGALEFTVNTLALTDGQHTLSVTAVDQLGNAATRSLLLNVDNTPPTASFTAPTLGSYSHGTLSLSFNYADANLASATLNIAGRNINVISTNAYTIDSTTLLDGNYTATLTVTDKAGNTVTSQTWFVIDNTKPLVLITSPNDGTTLSGTVTFTFSASDTNLQSVILYVDGRQFNVMGKNSYTWDSSNAPDGAHTIRLVATDKAGNQATNTIALQTNNLFLRIILGLVIIGSILLLFGYYLRRRRQRDRGKLSLPTISPPPNPIPEPTTQRSSRDDSTSE